MKPLLDFAGNQAVWLVAVAGAGRGHAWPGVVAAAVFVGWHLAVADDRARLLRLLAAAVAVALLFDGTLARLGWVRYAAAPEGAVAWMAVPAWILALWLAFVPMLTCSLAALQRRPWLAAVVGAIGGPLAFLAAARAFEAVDLTAPASRALVALALGWALAVPLLARLARPAAPRRTIAEILR